MHRIKENIKFVNKQLNAITLFKQTDKISNENNYPSHLFLIV